VSPPSPVGTRCFVPRLATLSWRHATAGGKSENGRHHQELDQRTLKLSHQDTQRRRALFTQRIRPVLGSALGHLCPSDARVRGLELLEQSCRSSCGRNASFYRVVDHAVGTGVSADNSGLTS